MRRPSHAIAFLIVLTGVSDLRSQDSRDFILAARRTGVAELIDATTLDTVARINFDFHVERLSASADGSTMYVDGYGDGGGCCKHYALNLSTLKLKLVNPTPGTLGLSPDGRWRFGITSFGGPALHTYDLYTGALRELIPPALPLTEDSCGGNWAAQGVWSQDRFYSKDRFYFYVGCPVHPGFLWTVSPGATELGDPTAVARFGEVPGCRHPLPVAKTVVAAAGKLLIYEGFGSKSDRTAGCQTPLPGGAWVLDPATGRLTRQIAAEVHFNRLIPNRSGSMLYGVDPGNPGWGGPVRLVALDGQDYRVIKSRTFDPGVLQIAIGSLRPAPAGDLRMASPEIP